MLALATEIIGGLVVVECKSRIARSEDAFRLRDTVTSLGDSRIIVLDLEDVSAIEGGGLGMLLFLHRWAYDREIRLKLFGPRDLFVRGCNAPPRWQNSALPHHRR